MNTYDKATYRQEIVMLSWPSNRISHFGNLGQKTIFSQAVKLNTNIRDPVTKTVPHKQVLMFVEVWWRGATEHGIIARDIRRNNLILETRQGMIRKRKLALVKQYTRHKVMRVPTIRIALQMDLMLTERPCQEDKEKTRIIIKMIKRQAWTNLKTKKRNRSTTQRFYNKQQSEMEAKQEEKAKKMAEVKAKILERRRRSRYLLPKRLKESWPSQRQARLGNKKISL